MHAIFPTHLIILDLIIQLIFDEEYNQAVHCVIFSSLLLHPIPLGPNILLVIFWHVLAHVPPLMWEFCPSNISELSSHLTENSLCLHLDF
jgi:hypothetical protein